MASGPPRSLALGLLLCAPLARGTAHPCTGAGTFDLPVGHYTWSCTKSESGVYPDSSAKILVLALSDTSEESLEAVESTALTQWATSTAKYSYDELETGSTYTLNFDDQTWTTHFILHVETAGAYGVFFEHVPYEFENGFHYLKSEGGDDIEHVFEEEGDHNHSHAHDHDEDEEEEHCPWELEWEWSAIFPVQEGWYDWNAQKVDDAYADASMKIVIIPTNGTDLHDLETQADTLWDAITDADHVDSGETIPLSEGTTLHFNQETWASHYKINIPAGTTYIAVFAEHFPIEFESAYHFLKDAAGEDIEPVAEESGAGCETAAAASTSEDDKIWGEVLAAAFITVLPTLVGIVLVVLTCMPQLKAVMADEGGFVAAIHSFASGVIFAVTVLHEIPQELSDFAVLITKGRMAWPMALTLNFMSGLSTVVGAIITYSIDVSSGVEGALLAAGAGVYLYVAMTDLGPAVGELMGDRALGAVARLLSFAVGATLIGLVLLDHEHCYAPVAESEEGAEAEASDGHGHGH